MLKRSILIATTLAPALALGACSTGTKNRGLESVHQPVVSRTDFVFDVNTSGNNLAPGEAQRLAGWMQSLRLGYGDRVAIDDPNPYGNGIRDDVQSQIGRYGLLLSDEAPITGAPVQPGMVRVVVSRMKAVVPGCPDFSRVSQPEFESNTSSNQGCGINSNLAAMTANPGDLVRGQPGSGVTDPAQSTKAIEVYRKAPASAGASAGTSGGKN
ncbi:pilus assembly protein CpaD [Sphingomonas sp. So64.6b]|uniref:CpaD family pilus assembly protein n=1 Tax=Sphingomonas sp. So64.6b TaxID=2997354 RepID=UPI001602468F|nr:CpaD family pilus assembly protein [Sphingomonas sp. So64.6b]QNA84767.1 pilus assembly protein CpaD [Sphingomonas sp. So64.6b]